VNGRIVVNNDGIHAALQQCAPVQLQPGLAVVKVEGFQAVGKVQMALTLSGPDTDNHKILPESEIYQKASGGGIGWRVRVYAAAELLVKMPDMLDMGRLDILGDTHVKTIHVEDAADFDDLVAGVCAVCRKGHYCPGAFPTSNTNPKALEMQCPERRFSTHVGATTMSECNACRPGHFGRDSKDCTRCPQDRYCPGGDSVLHCPPGSVTNGTGKQSIAHCMCDQGYQVRVSSMVKWDCVACRKRHYCATVGGDPQVCPGNADSPEGSTSAAACACDAGQYDVGSSCKECSAGYYCVGDGTRSFCGPDAASAESSTSVQACAADDIQVFTDVYEGSLPTCTLMECHNVWLGTLMKTCTHLSTCRGVTMDSGTYYGWGCLAVGLKACLNQLAISTDAIPKTFYAKRMDVQPRDSVAMMRKMHLPIPACPHVGQPVVLHAFCNPHSHFRTSAWKGILYKGTWDVISATAGGGCDDDLRLCTDSGCNLPSNALASLDIPPNLEVDIL